MRTPITFQSYFNCIEIKQDWWRSFGGLRIYLIFLLLTIYLHNKYRYYGNKGKYIYSNDGALTRWRHHVYTTPRSDLAEIHLVHMCYFVCNAVHTSHTQWIEVGVWGWLVGSWRFMTWQYLRLYQDGHRLVTECTHSEFLVLPHWEIGLLEP